MIRKLMIAGVAALALGACTKAERQDTASDVQAAADKVAAETKDAVNSPEVKEVGAEIKDAAGDAGQVIKDAAKGAAKGAREGAAKVEAESKDAAHDAEH
jgi:hypothetical protein